MNNATLIKILCLHFFCLLGIHCSMWANFQESQEDMMIISSVEIDESNNSISLFVNPITSFIAQNSIWKDPTNFRIDLKNGYETYTNLLIKSIAVADNKLILETRLPLKDAQCFGEPREFILHLPETKKRITKFVHIGSVINPYDLRSYTLPNASKSLTVTVVIFILIIGLLVFLTSLYGKFRFKQQYVKKFKQESEEEVLDPFTFVPINKGDWVVDKDEKTILLSSWKRINNLDSEKKQDYKLYLEEENGDSFFNPKTLISINSFKALFGAVGIFTGWLLFSVLNTSNKNPFFETLRVLFDTENEQLSSSIAGDVFLGCSIAFFFGLFFNTAQYILQRENKNSPKLLFNMLLQVVIICSGFMLQAFLVHHMIPNTFLTSLVSWICSSLFFCFAIYPNLKHPIFFLYALVVGLVTFCIYQIGILDYFLRPVGYGPTIFLSLIVTVIFMILLSKEVKVSPQKTGA